MIGSASGRVVAWGTLVLLLAGAMGCGYTVSTRLDADPDMLRVCVEPFKNLTQPYEPGVEIALHREVLNLILRGPYELTDLGNADLHVTGSVTAFRQQVLSQDADNNPEEVQITLQVRMTVREVKRGRTRTTETLPAITEPFAINQGEVLEEAAQRGYRAVARQILTHFVAPEHRIWATDTS